MIKMTKVSVVIPTLNREEVLLKTCRDLFRQQYANFEIIIVDQTPKINQKIYELVKKEPKLVKYLHVTKKSSPNARNIGVKAASGEIILFIDDDVAISERNFIHYHVESYKDKKVALVGGRVIEKFSQQKLIREVGKIKYFGLKEITNFDAKIQAEIDHAPGGNFSCLKKVYVQVGGFCNLYKGNAHLEETDFSLQVQKAGYKLIFQPKAVLKHLRYPSGGNRRNDIYEFRYWLVHNYIFFYLRNYPKIFFPLCFLKEWLWALFSLLKRKDIKMYQKMTQAIFDGLRYYKNVQAAKTKKNAFVTLY